MPLGAGACPAGSSAAGYGVPDKGTQPNSSILPDALTGLPQPGRLIDPTSQDYVFTSDGRLEGFGAVDQLVQLALRTQIGTSAIATLGIDMTQATEQGADFQRRVATMVANALGPLVNQKLVQIVSVTLQQTPSNPDAGVAIVKWRDLTLGTENETTVGP